jgi:hypothetical protein
VAVLSGRDAESLTLWLTINGFGVTREDESAIAAYVKDGWFFTASRLRRDDPAVDTLTPQPLVLKFSTPTPVYPMRLTAQGMDEALELDIYVFGPGTAKAQGLEVVATNAVVRALDGGGPSRSVYEVVHSTLNSLTVNAAHLTLLRGVIPRESITSDLAISFESPRYKRPWVVSHGAAHLAAGTVASGAALIAAAAFLVRFRGAAPRGKRGVALLPILLAALAGYGVTVASMPGVATISGRAPWREIYRLKEGAQKALYFRSYGDEAAEPPASLDEARQRVAAWFLADRVQATEGDAPGQYRLELTGETIDLVYVDRSGREQRDWAGSLKPAPTPDPLKVPATSPVGGPVQGA